MPNSILFPFEIYSHFELGDMTAYYLKQDQSLAFTILPKGLEHKISAHRKSLNDTTACRSYTKGYKTNLDALTMENMIQYHIQKDSLSSNYFPGNSMINNGSLKNLKFVSQTHENNVIKTIMKDPRGIESCHTVTYHAQDSFMEVNTTLKNDSGKTIDVDFLSSFNLGMLSPFAADDGPNRYFVHRYSAWWDAEGRHQEQSVESLGLEPAPMPIVGRALQFGNRSSLPVKGYFPTLGLEDRIAGVTWGVQLAALGPWLLEINRIADSINLSGGLPNADFGNWRKTLKDGEEARGIPAIITCCEGDMQKNLNRLTQWQAKGSPKEPESEENLPVIYNEYCTSWGRPTSERLLKIADILKNRDIKYFVIDAGWFRSDPCKYPGKGDWEISKERFPDFDSYISQIYKKGFIPGVWFEFENINKTQSRFGEEHPELVLKYHGETYSTGDDNAPLDFRREDVQKQMTERVIGFIKKHRIGYVKIDYNYAVIGADTPNGSETEGLLENLEAAKRFYQKMKKECPELVMEICASGGHRLTPEWMRLGSMASFSDSCEAIATPLIAAGTAMQILLKKNQVWAPLRKESDPKRMAYLLAAGFIGRLCISGDIDQLDKKQLAQMDKAIQCYREAVPFIQSGESFVEEKRISESWTHPQGYQVFHRKNKQGEILVVHSFADAPQKIEIAVDTNLHIVHLFDNGEPIAKQNKGVLTIENMGCFNGMVLILKRKTI